MQIQVPAKIKNFVAPEAPDGLRLKAAMGLVPMKTGELVLLYSVLAGDDHPKVAEAARRSLEKMPEKLLLPVLAKTGDGALLDFFGRSSKRAAVIEKVVLNPRTPNEVLIHMARSAPQKIVEIISNNQERLIADPEISAAILQNRGIGVDLAARVREFRKRFLGAEEEGLAAQDEQAAEMLTFEAEELGLSEILEEETAAADAGEEFEYEDFPDDFPEEFIVETKSEASEEKITNMIKYIAGLNVSGKIKLALLGNKEARSILIKEPNRLVCTAVMRNPRISDPEVESISKSRSLDEGVYRAIARNKDWMKRYDIKKNLAFNSKVPMDLAMAFVKFLTPKDMRDLSRSKDVPATVSGTAKRIINTKEEAERRKKERK